MRTENPAGKWRVLVLLSLAELLSMAVWFSASAVVPALTEAWSLTDSGRAWLTISVQLGFVTGALGAGVLNLSDRLPAHRVFTVSAFMAGLFTLLIPLTSRALMSAVLLRFLTGMTLAGVYPVGMKIMATWTRADRGLGIGLLVGALTLGSAAPHLINALGAAARWETVLGVSAGLAFLGSAIALVSIREGPYRAASPPFNWRYAGKIFTEREIALVNLGYLGHMWELYAMWSWIPLFLLRSFELRGISPAWAGFAAFAVIAVGGLGSAAAGRLADTFGRTRVAIVAMGVSGACALVVGLFFGGNPFALTALSLLWGFTVVADSAQFSAAASELADRAYVGTVLTLQTSLGFLLTVFTIRLVPTLEAWLGWRWAFAFLAFGPVVGIWAMAALMRSPAAARLAGGRG